MAKQTIKGYIVYRTEHWRGDDERFSFTCYDPREFKDDDKVFVGEHSMEVEVPDNFDPREYQIEALREQKKKAAAAYAAMVKELDDRINRLLALEMS